MRKMRIAPGRARRAMTLVAGLFGALSLTGAAQAAGDTVPDSTWAATWAASPEPPRSPPTVLNNQTIRELARVSLGGGRFRVRLTNEYGAKPVTIASAHIAIATGVGAQIQTPSDRQLTFNGKAVVTIPAFSSVVSDSVDVPVPNLSTLAVSLYFPGPSGDATSHFFGLQTAYVAAGAQTSAADLPGAATLTERPFVSAIEVGVAKKTKVIAAIGDSITDGFGSQMGANHRWPDHLAERLVARKAPTYFAVINTAISGNRLLHDFIGPNALSRLDRDVLAQSGVSHLIVLEGVNDFGFPGARKLLDEEVTADDVIMAYRQIILRAHAHGIKVIGATLPPFGPIPSRPGFYSEASAAKRVAVNAWIRSGRAFDGVIDFDAVLRDPKDPTRLNPLYDSGDHLNPNDAGYKAMADAIDLKLFD
ncbi:SGNH/GDSL hydrolase family protein [Caulobacter sp. KR2-114]|uniref:SGNH/GDSL hydrolase family protein n=1 Tax=Caulobacter sp. KR2-114 TaxID=3400912 RepID=UPI003C01C1E7